MRKAKAGRSRKGQMEILGLAVIVILVSLGMLFVVKFVILEKPSTSKATFTHTQMASNMLNSLLKTSTGCRGTDVTELLQDYVTSRQIVCPDRSSQEQLDMIFNDVFNQTLNTWKKQYLFTVSLNDNVYFVQQNGECEGMTQRQSETFPLPTEKGTMIIRLDICS